MQISRQTPQLPATIIYSKVQKNKQQGIYQQTAKFYSLLYVPQIAIMLIQVGQNIRKKAKLNKITC